MNLRQLIDHARQVYGRRNSVYFRGTPDRIDFLLVALGDLHEAIDRHEPQAVVSHMLARLLARIMCVIDAYKSVPVVETMCRKYPLTHCTYCGKLPCGCPDKRPDYQLVPETDAGQLDWSLRDWCSAMDRMYGEKNSAREIDTLIGKLYKEVTELLSYAARPEGIKGDLYDTEEKLALEITDILAWTIAIANRFKADLETAYLDIYGDGCRKCGHEECRCPTFRYGQLDWSRYAPVARSRRPSCAVVTQAEA